MLKDPILELKISFQDLSTTPTNSSFKGRASTNSRVFESHRLLSKFLYGDCILLNFCVIFIYKVSKCHVHSRTKVHQFNHV